MDEFQQEYLDDMAEKVSKIEASILSFENMLDVELFKKEVYIDLKRVVHSIKGSAGSYDLNFASTVCHNMEDYLMFAEGSGGMPSDFVDVLLKFQEILSSYCEKANGNSNVLQVDLEQKLISVTPLARQTDGEKVLIIEPSNIISDIYRRYLGKLGFQVSVSKDSYQALGRLLEEQFDVVVTGNLVKPIDGVSFAKMVDVSGSVSKDLDIYIASSNQMKLEDLPSKIKGVFMKDSSLGKSVFTEFEKRIKNVESKVSENVEKLGTSSKPLKKVFYVDDDVFIHKIAKLGLKKLKDVEVLFFHSGEEALAAAEGNPPDMVILDYMMPGMDGPTTCEKIREINGLKDVGVVFLTAASSDSEQARLKSLSPLGIVSKPIRPKSFSLEILNLWNGSV